LPAKDFEKLLVEAIDEELSSLGEDMKQTVYSHLQEAFGVQKSEIANNVTSFTQAVEHVFGMDANDLEALILRNVHEKIGKRYESNIQAGLTFEKRVKLARSQLYKDFVSAMQSPAAVFYLEDSADLRSFTLIAFNSAAERLGNVAAEEVLGKTMPDIYPEALDADVQEKLTEVLRYGRPRELGEFHHLENSGIQKFSVSAFVLSSSCVGLVLKNVLERRSAEVKKNEVREQADAVDDGMGGWRWEPEVVDKEVDSGKFHAREQWGKRKLSGGPRSAEFFSIRGREYLKDGEYSRAREFFVKAEELFQKMDQTEEAFRSASLRISAYLLEEKTRLPEFSGAAEQYFEKYAEFFMHENFVENLAYYDQWKGYQNEQEHSYAESRERYCQAEELFLTLKRKKDAVFNASRSVLTYRDENRRKEFSESARVFFQKYAEFSEDKHYKEVLAHDCSQNAEKSGDIATAVRFRSEAERLFLEIGERPLAFENACKLIELYWDALVPEDDQLAEKCYEETERFFDRYADFSENEFYRKKLAEYYLHKARALASRLKRVVR
jgi:PAS domain-containing protein